MKGKGEILKMICPFCGLEMNKVKKELTTTPHYQSYFLNQRSFKTIFVDEFRCRDCVYVFNFGWLNDEEFNQYESFVLRRGEDKKKWVKLLRKDYKENGILVESVEQWKRRIEKLKELQAEK